MMTSVLLAYALHHFSAQQAERIERLSHSIPVVVSQVEGRAFPPGAQRIHMADIAIVLPCSGNLVLESIDLQRRGPGRSSDIAAVYLSMDGKKLHRPRTVSRRGGVSIPLRNVTLRSCSKNIIHIFVDIAADADIASIHAFHLAGITADATFTIQHTSVQQGARVTGLQQGSIQVSYPKLLRRIRYGRNREVSRILLEASGRRAQKVSSIRITNEGSARNADLQNIALYYRRSRVSTTIKNLDKDSVVLEFTPPLYISRNAKKLLSLRADVRASRSKTLQLLVQDPSDIVSHPTSSRY